MKTIQKVKKYNASPEAVFDCLDDLGITGMHMTESSMPMMGGKMNLEFITQHKTGPHTKYRWTGEVLWWVLNFTVEVTNWIKGKEKTWQTIGPAQIIFYSWFQMNLVIEANSIETIARLSINYEKSKGIFNRFLCVLLGSFYARWCLKNILNDTEKKMAAPALHHAIKI